MDYFVYALRSLIDCNLYVGISADPQKRLHEHNAGMQRSTKHRKPFKLIYQEKCSDRQRAREREKTLKTGAGREFLKQIP